MTCVWARQTALSAVSQMEHRRPTVQAILATSSWPSPCTMSDLFVLCCECYAASASTTVNSCLIGYASVLHPASAAVAAKYLSHCRHLLQDDPKFKQAMRARNPEQRLRAFLHHCQGKRECPYTNAPQPVYRLDGVKISLEFPKPKSDDDAPAETGDRKQVRIAHECTAC